MRQQLRFFSWKFFFCVLVLSLSFVYQGHADDDVYTNPIENQDTAGGNGYMVKGDTTNYFGWSLWGSGGVIFDGNTLTPGTLKPVAASIMGSYYNLSLDYRPQYSAYSFEARYQGLSTPYSKMTSFTPTSFNVVHTNVRGLMLFRPMADKTTWKNLYVGVGYTSNSRTVDQTISPLSFVDQTLSGPVIAIGNRARISSKFNYEADIYANFYNSISEPKQGVSGQLQNGMGLEVNLRVIYPYTELIDIALGVWMQMDMLTFKNSSTRSGASNVTESETVLGAPLEIIFKF